MVGKMLVSFWNCNELLIYDTQPNPALTNDKKKNDTNGTTSDHKKKYHPAWMLMDYNLERAGRIQKKKKDNVQ